MFASSLKLYFAIFAARPFPTSGQELGIFADKSLVDCLSLNVVNNLIKYLLDKFPAADRGPPQKKINTEEEAKVQSLLFGEKIYSIPRRTSYFARKILKNWLNSSFYFKSSQCYSSFSLNRPVQNNQRGQKLNKFFPPNRSDDLCRFFFLYLSSMGSPYSN